MKNQSLNDLFSVVLNNMYSSEIQIIEALPRLTFLASSSDLKAALVRNLKDTQNQIARLDQISFLLGMETDDKPCEVMQALIHEAKELTEDREKSSALDAAIISVVQKIEHYEIAAYHSLLNFAKNLKCENQIRELIQENLDEEIAADTNLTCIAEGTLFTYGINRAAARAGTVCGWKCKSICR